MRKKKRWRSVRIPNPPGYGCLFSWRLRIWKPFGNILSQKIFGIVWFEVIWCLERAILRVDCKFSTNGFMYIFTINEFSSKLQNVILEEVLQFTLSSLHKMYLVVGSKTSFRISIYYDLRTISFIKLSCIWFFRF